MFLYSMRPYVIVVGCVHVPGVPVLVKSGHRIHAYSNADVCKSKYCPAAAGPRIISSKLHTGLTKMMCKIKYKTGLTPFYFSGPEFVNQDSFCALLHT